MDDATSGRFAHGGLTTYAVNALVIRDKVDKVTEQNATFNWTCPYFHLPFDMSRL